MSKKPDMKSVEKVAVLQHKGLSDRQMAKLMGKHHKQIQRWRSYIERGDLIHSQTIASGDR